MLDRFKLFRSEGDPGPGVTDPAGEPEPAGEPAASAAIDIDNLPTEVVDAWLRKNKLAAFPSTDARVQKFADELEGRTPAKEPDPEDDDAFVFKKDLRGMEDKSATKAEQRMTARYAALESLTDNIGKYDLPAEAKAEVRARFMHLPLEQLEASLQGGKDSMVAKFAKATMYDLIQDGKVQVKGRTPIAEGAPTGQSQPASGLKGRLNAEQKSIIEANEKMYGIPYSDDMIKEAFGLG